MRLAERCKSAPMLPSVMVRTAIIHSTAAMTGGMLLSPLALQPTVPSRTMSVTNPCTFGTKLMNAATGLEAPS